MADNLGDRLQRAIRPKDPLNTDGPHFLDMSGTMTLTNGGGGVSQADDTGFVPGVSSLSPIGAYVGGRQVGSGHIGAPAMNGSGMLIVAVGAGGAGGGVAQNQVLGTAGNWLNVGYASGSDFQNTIPILGSINPHGVFAAAGSMQILGSVNIVPPPNMTVWLANQNAGSGFASVAVYGSPANPVFVQFPSGYYPSINSAGAAGAAFASVAVYGSPAMPVYVVGSQSIVNGSLPVINLGGSVGALGIGGSMGVTQIGAPWSVVGSMGVTPLASFTVNLGLIPTVNLGLAAGIFGSVSVLGSVNMGGVGVVDVRGSLVPTTWIISGAASGQFVVAGSAPANQRIWLSSFHLVTDGTADMQWMSPSGIAISGSMRMLPGAGFAMAGAFPAGPIVVGSQNSALYLRALGTLNVGGIAMGWVA